MGQSHHLPVELRAGHDLAILIDLDPLACSQRVCEIGNGRRARFACCWRPRSKFIQALVRLGQHLASQQRYEEAIGWYLKGLDTDPIVEPFYQGSMRCCDRLDRRPEAIDAYRRLKQTLSVSLGVGLPRGRCPSGFSHRRGPNACTSRSARVELSAGLDLIMKKE